MTTLPISVQLIRCAAGMSGVWGASPLNLSYLSNTIAHPQQKRAIVIALIK